MAETFKNFLRPFIQLIGNFLNALNVLITTYTDFSLKAVEIDFKLLSESPIFTLSLYDILFYVLLFVILFAFYKLFKLILLLPFNLIKRWGNKY